MDAAYRGGTQHEPAAQNGPPVDLFEYHANAAGGWVMLDVPECAI